MFNNLTQNIHRNVLTNVTLFLFIKNVLYVTFWLQTKYRIGFLECLKQRNSHEFERIMNSDFLSTVILGCTKSRGYSKLQPLAQNQTDSYKQSSFQILNNKLLCVHFVLLSWLLHRVFYMCLIVQKGIPQPINWDGTIHEDCCIASWWASRYSWTTCRGCFFTPHFPARSPFLSMTFLRRRLYFPGVNVEDVGNLKQNHLPDCELPPVAFQQVCLQLCSAVCFFFLLGTICTFFSHPETLCNCAKATNAVAYLV